MRSGFDSTKVFKAIGLNFLLSFKYFIKLSLFGATLGHSKISTTLNTYTHLYKSELEDMTKICPNADLYIHSHTHVPLSYTDRCFIFNRYRNTMEEHYRTFFNTNSFLDYGGYAEMYGFKPTDLTPYTLSINTKRSGTIMRPITNTLKLDI